MARVEFQMLLLLASFCWTFNETHSTVTNSTTLYFGLMLSLSGDDQSSGALAGVQAALDEINSRDDLLPGYSLNFTPIIDSKCDRRAALDGLFSQLFQSPHQKIALIGSGCSAINDATAEISYYYNLTYISCTSSFSELGNLNGYFQLLPSEVNLAHVFYSIIKEYGWRRVALIVQNQPRFKAMIYSLMTLLSDAITVHSQLSFDDKEERFGQITFDPQFRIYVLAMDSKLARKVLCKANRMGMRYPKYVFLTYGTYEPQWWMSQGNHSEDECTSDDLAYTLQYSLAVSHFNTSMMNSILYHICHDAVYSLAYALKGVIQNGGGDSMSLKMDNKTISECRYTSSISLLINEQLRYTNFTGNSGPVRFDENGIRHVTELHVLQYRATNRINETPLHQDGSLSRRLKLIDVVYVSGENESLDFVDGSKNAIWPEWPLQLVVCDQLSRKKGHVYSDYGGREGLHILLSEFPNKAQQKFTLTVDHIPYDGEPREQYVTILTPVTVVFMILNTSGIVYAVICFMFNAIFHKKRIVRIDSPNLNYLIIVGAILVYFGCMAFVTPVLNPSAVSALCAIRSWLPALGYTMIYGSVIAKLWRICTIFRNPKTVKNNRGIKDQHLLLIVLSLTLIDIFILTTYMIVEGVLTHFSVGVAFNKEKPSAIHGELEVETVYKRYTCSTNTWIRRISLSLVYLYKFFLYICALYFAFRLRNIKMKGLNDAKYIAGFVYTTSVLIAITFISTLTLSEYINVYAAIYSFGFWFVNSSILSLLFVPKMIRYYRDPNGTQVLSSNDKTLPNQNGKLPKLESSDVDGLKQRVRELEDLLNKHNILWNKCEDT